MLHVFVDYSAEEKWRTRQTKERAREPIDRYVVTARAPPEESQSISLLLLNTNLKERLLYIACQKYWMKPRSDKDIPQLVLERWSRIQTLVQRWLGGCFLRGGVVDYSQLRSFCRPSDDTFMWKVENFPFCFSWCWFYDSLVKLLSYDAVVLFVIALTF